MAYTAQQQAALRMIQRRGVTTTLTRVGPVTVDNTRDVATAGGPQKQSVVAVLLPITESRDRANASDTNRRRNRRRVLIGGLAASGSALAWEPDDNHTIALEGATWSIDGISRIAPDGGAPIYFDGEVQR